MSNDTKNTGACAIELCDAGPLIVHGPANLNGEPLKAGTALCRCGQSANKPFCDGSHKAAGFADSGSINDSGITGDAHGDGPARLKTAKNGPIMCAGPITLTSADGSQSIAGARAALCRCGLSANKPYCDGTHGTEGFVAD
jgi:CDGSH-type Zn-finger protein